MSLDGDPRVVGKRLLRARKAKHVTQEQAAEHIGCSRPTLIAIEKGERIPKASEVIALGELYGVSVHEIVNVQNEVVSFQPHLRAAAERMSLTNSDLDEAICAFGKLVESYRELESLMDSPLASDYPPTFQIKSTVDPRIQAEDVADQERRRLGLGDEPSMHLRSILEDKVGLRIFYYKLPSILAGMYAYDDASGGCIMVNSVHPPDRRRASLLHEYGHLIASRYRPGIDFLEYGGRKPPDERFADSFSMAFLMPARDVRQRFCDVVDRSGDFQVADLCILAHHSFVSVEAMALRLEGLNLIPRGTISYFKEECDFKVKQAQESLGLRPGPESSEMLPRRYRMLAIRAFLEEKLSEGQLSSLLHCDRVSAREAVRDFQEGPSWHSREGTAGVRIVDSGRSLLKK